MYLHINFKMRWCCTQAVLRKFWISTCRQRTYFRKMEPNVCQKEDASPKGKWPSPSPFLTHFGRHRKSSHFLRPCKTLVASIKACMGVVKSMAASH